MSPTGAVTVVVLFCACVVLPSNLTVALNVNKIVSIPEFPKENVTTGNKILYEQTGNATADTGSQFMEVNEIPVRYDEAQLWRIYNISMLRSSSSQVTQALEDRFGGEVWKENSKFLDISFRKEQVKNARSYLQGLNISPEVLNKNIQNLLDQEEVGSTTDDFKSPRIKKASRLGGINWDEYHDLDVIYDFMKEIRLAHPDLCRLYSIGKTVEGRELKVMRISENPKDNKKIWIDGGIHAREWISPAVVTYILYNLLTNWSTLPKHITSKTWYVMPVLNPDGYMYSRKKNRLWRKNRSRTSSRCIGVDLNRNYDINWRGPGSSSDPCSDVYRGPSAASELETRAVVAFLSRRKNNLGAYLTFHSYGELITYPWAYRAAKVKDHKDLQTAAQQAVDKIKKETGRSYRAASTYQVLGIAGGGSDDWCRASLGTKYVYTVELRDKGNYGFVLPKAQIKGTAKEGYTIVDTITSFF